MVSDAASRSRISDLIFACVEGRGSKTTSTEAKAGWRFRAPSGISASACARRSTWWWASSEMESPNETRSEASLAGRMVTVEVILPLAGGPAARGKERYPKGHASPYSDGLVD